VVSASSTGSSGCTEGSVDVASVLSMVADEVAPDVGAADVSAVGSEPPTVGCAVPESPAVGCGEVPSAGAGVGEGESPATGAFVGACPGLGAFVGDLVWPSIVGAGDAPGLMDGLVLLDGDCVGRFGGQGKTGTSSLLLLSFFCFLFIFFLFFNRRFSFLAFCELFSIKTLLSAL
jgi:hypothetical protein